MLKDKWKDLQDAVEGILGSGDDISAEHLNLIANELIKSQSDIEKNKTNKANKTDLPTKVSQLLNDLSFTTESKVKEMIEELPPVLWGEDIDTKYTVDEFIPPLMMYASDMLDDAGNGTGEHYANAPYVGAGIIISGSYIDNEYRCVHQVALSDEGVMVIRDVYEEQKFADISWSNDLIPKKVSQLANDKEYTTKKDVEDVIKETKAEANEIYANALKGLASGNDIILNDLSPCQHTIKANLHSENLVNIEVNEKNNSCDYEITDNVFKITKNSNQYSPSFYVYLGKYEDYKGKTITFSIKRLEKTGTSTTTSNDILYLTNGKFSNCKGFNYPFVATATVSKVSDTYNHYKTITIPEDLEYEDLYFRLYAQTIVNPDEYNVYSDLMCAFGSGEKPYKPYVDVEGAKLKIYGKTTEDNVQEHTVDANGNVEGVISSLYPTMNFSVDRENVIINVEYNKDINKAFEEMQQAIISMGGNV